jgi:hypothetical protein
MHDRQMASMHPSQVVFKHQPKMTFKVNEIAKFNYSLQGI